MQLQLKSTIRICFSGIYIRICLWINIANCDEKKWQFDRNDPEWSENNDLFSFLDASFCHCRFSSSSYSLPLPAKSSLLCSGFNNPSTNYLPHLACKQRWWHFQPYGGCQLILGLTSEEYNRREIFPSFIQELGRFQIHKSFFFGKDFVIFFHYIF